MVDTDLVEATTYLTTDPDWDRKHPVAAILAQRRLRNIEHAGTSMAREEVCIRENSLYARDKTQIRCKIESQ